MKSVWCYVPFLCFLPLANAQSALDFSVGFGSAFDSATGLGIDNLNSPNAFGGCIPNGSDTFCQATPKLGGFFMGIAGDIMFRKHLGVGAEVSFKPTQSNYGPLKYRQTFYDVNAIYEPYITRRAIVQLQGGIGAAKTGFSYTQSACVGTAVCSSAAQSLGSSNHFQVHLGAGVQFLVWNHIYVSPQFDLHLVHNLTDQFGRNAVPQVMISLGYHLGER